MEMFTFDQLLSDVNSQVKRPSDEELRIGMLHSVRHVFMKIGYEYVCDLVIDEPLEVKDWKCRIPNDVIKVIDVYANYGQSGIRGRGHGVRPGQKTNRPYEFYKNAFELKFTNFKCGQLFSLCYKFYKDEQGSLLIPSEAYMACKEYGIYEGVRNLSNPQHPLWQERYLMERKTENLISEAIGELNSPSEAEYRANRFIQ